MKQLVTILVAFISCSVYGQEKLYDLSFSKDYRNVKQAKKVSSKIFYTPDTLIYPFVDDFSGNKFKSYATANAKDSLLISNYTDTSGVTIPDSSFSLDTTFRIVYTIDTATNDTLQAKTAFKDSILLYVSDTVFPVKLDTVSVFPKYNIHDSTWLAKIDTIQVTAKLNSTDSTIWKIIPADITNTKIWLNSNVYINNHLPVKPPSIGAVVFDGLDSNGQPYDTVVTKFGQADLLTSKPIDLSVVPNDNVQLTFFYQPQGLTAEAPDKKDSLILEFKNGSSNWEQVWFTIGNGGFKDFEKVSVLVNSKYRTNDFQFRFKNYATLSGNLDVWLVDYIKLDKTTEINDVAFSKINSNFLKDYSAAPWKHYLSKPTSLDTDLLFEIKNNYSSLPKNVKFDASIYDAFGTSIFEFTDNSSFVSPTIHFNEGLRHSAFTQFPSNSADSSIFTIKSFISSGLDELPANDTVTFQQKFYNYYAYDDGTAETGYGLENSQDGMVAYQFLALKTDTLRAVQIYFNRSLEQNIGVEFDLMIWDDFNAAPIVQQLDTTKYYGINNYVTYKLQTPIVIGNTFYVGYKKRSSTYLNIGFDRNDTLDSKIYFNTGVWSPSNKVGALMIRPVFGSDFVVGEEEQQLASQFKVYPNPSSEIVKIQSEFEVEKIEVLNVLGNEVIAVFNEKQVNISDLTVGLYFIRIYTGENIIIKKIIKQ